MEDKKPLFDKNIFQHFGGHISRHFGLQLC